MINDIERKIKAIEEAPVVDLYEWLLLLFVFKQIIDNAIENRHDKTECQSPPKTVDGKTRDKIIGY